MTSLTSFMPSFALAPTVVEPSAKNRAAAVRLQSASFTHALVALAAKLAAVDGVPTKAEYAAFQALFVEGSAAEATQVRTLFLRRVTDSSPALQYAREIAGMTQGETALHLDLLSRLLRVATADAAINAAELELLRAVATILGIDRETFRGLVARTMVPTSASPYEVLGIASRSTDAALREHYMHRVQQLHPDRYQAAGASAETIAMLSDQLAAVNAAYQTVQKLRAKKTTAATGWWSRLNTKGAKA